MLPKDYILLNKKTIYSNNQECDKINLNYFGVIGKYRAIRIAKVGSSF